MEVLRSAEQSLCYFNLTTFMQAFFGRASVISVSWQCFTEVLMTHFKIDFLMHVRLVTVSLNSAAIMRVLGN